MVMSIHINDMMTLFRKELELCGVTEGTKVTVLSEVGRSEDYVTASMIAARNLGAQVFNLSLLPTTGLSPEEKTGNVGVTALAGNQTAIDALKSADLVIDLMFLLFSKEQLEIQAAGTRVLLVAEPFESLFAFRMFGIAKDLEQFRKSLASYDHHMYATIRDELDGFRSKKKGVFLTNTRHAYKGIKRKDGQFF